MKTLLLVSAVCATAIVGACSWIQSRSHTSSVPVSAVLAARKPDSPSASLAISAPPPPVRARPGLAAKPSPASSDLAPADAQVGDLASAIADASSSKMSFAQRHALWRKLREGGQLNAAIVALKQSALDNPGDPMVALALGEAEYTELGRIAEAGAPFNERAILALQADQDFSAALKLDPTNWEAQFEKASALSHWPASMNKGPEVIQRLTTLVAQQQSMAPQPEFAETYLMLGNAYQSTGQSTKATEIWQAGLTQFPQNPRLQQKLTGATQ